MQVYTEKTKYSSKGKWKGNGKGRRRGKKKQLKTRNQDNQKLKGKQQGLPKLQMPHQIHCFGF